MIYNILDVNPFILIYQIYSKEGEGGEMWWTEKLGQTYTHSSFPAGLDGKACSGRPGFLPWVTKIP